MEPLVDAYQWAIRFLHIMSGVMWIGGLYLWGMVIAPSVTKRVPPPARGPFMGVIIPRVTRYFGIAGVVTVVTGFWNMGLIVGFGEIVPSFRAGTWGMALGAGVVLSVLMIIVAYGVIIPTSNRLLALMPKPGAAPPAGAPAGGPPSPPPEVVALQKKIMIGGMTNLLLGTIALAVMALAVNARIA